MSMILILYLVLLIVGWLREELDGWHSLLGLLVLVGLMGLFATMHWQPYFLTAVIGVLDVALLLKIFKGDVMSL
jgi:hypothetical protein